MVSKKPILGIYESICCFLSVAVICEFLKLFNGVFEAGLAVEVEVGFEERQ